MMVYRQFKLKKIIRVKRKNPKRYKMKYSTPTPIINPTSKHSASVIFLHGLGDTGYGWSPVFEQLKKSTPHVKYIFPTANTRPVSLNYGMEMPAWYDIKDLSSLGKDDYEGFNESQEQIKGLIEQEINLGIPSNRIILGGFSQGGACSITIGYSFSKTLAGILGISCYLLNQSTFQREISENNRNTPFILFHGTDDQMVRFQWGKQSFDYIRNTCNIPGQFKSINGIGHEVTMEEMEEVMSWIKEKLPLQNSKL